MQHLADPFLDVILKEAVGDELIPFLEEVRRFSRDEVLAQTETMRAEGHIPADLIGKMARIGYFGAGIPERYGGAGLGVAGSCVVAYELGYGSLDVSLVPVATGSLFGKAVELSGNDDQRAEILPKVASGEWFGSYGLTELKVGSSSSGKLRTKAEKRGGVWVLNGEKGFITEAARANRMVVYARDVTEASPTRGKILAFVAPNKATDRKGYEAIPSTNKPGIHESDTCTVFIDDVEVDERYLLGVGTEKVGKGLKFALGTLTCSRPTIAAQAAGNAAAALAYIMQYAAQTPRGDGTDFLYKHPLYQAELMERIGELSQATAYLFMVARAIDRGFDPDDEFVRAQTSMAKKLVTNASTPICQMAMELAGGAGYSHEHPLARRWIDSAVTEIYEGSSLVQLEQAGKSMERYLEAHGPNM